MEASALKYHPGIGLPSRSPLLRLQSDERLITLLRRGNTAAFEVLVGRYETRPLPLRPPPLGPRGDAAALLLPPPARLARRRRGRAAGGDDRRVPRDRRRQPADQRAAVALPDR